jgi:UDP-N-acetylmuramate dehydrogenase
MTLAADLYTVVETPLLAARTSIRLGGEAIAEVRLHSTQGLEHLPGLLARVGGQIKLIGEGTNLLVDDGRLPFVLVNFERHNAPEVVREEGDEVLVHADAGMRLAGLLAWSARHGLSGLEGLAGIPGSVGGAVAMNAGSFGVETASRLREVSLFSPSLGLVERPITDFEHGYRHFSLRGHSGWMLITGALWSMRRSPASEVRERIKKVFVSKQERQPITGRSAGCVFKNPAPDAPAGLLLDQAGMKGASVGDMYFSTLHANFLLNRGRGTFAQAMELIELARERVRRHSGHELELEVQVWR